MSALPQRIGSYRIEEKLGGGGMGEVYRAYDEDLDRQVAIKLIRTTEMGSATSQERFRREARTVAALDHPSIVRVYHVLQWEDRDCIVMEHVEGRTLTALLRAGPPGLDEISKWPGRWPTPWPSPTPKGSSTGT